MPALDRYHEAVRKLWQAFFTDENGKALGYDVESEEIVQWLP